MKERKLYSLTGKLIVFLLLIVFAASALFGGIQTLMLSSVGLTPNAAAKKYAFEETTACGTLVQRQLHNVMSYYNDMSKFGTNGRYDGTKEIDYRAFATDGEGSGGISTTYTIDQLVKMYDDGSSADLNEVAAYTADNYATNDAGIDKEAYLAYEDGTDVSQETEETDVAALTEEVSAADAETFDSFSPDGEVYFPSDNAVKSLKEKKIDPADVSSQFLYLYDQGMSLETQKTKAGTYLYEYAAANLKKVSIRDLYMTLSGVTEEVAAFKNQESGISVDADDANLWYCLEDKEGNIYTNVDSWKNGYTTAIAQKSPYPFAFAVDRTGGADKVRSYATRKNSPAVEAARSYLLNNQIADNYQKIFVALDPDLAASDYFSQYSEIYSQWLPKMQLLLLMIAVGGIGTLVCLVLFTLQAGRNGKNKEIRLYFFDQWYTEIAAAAAILIVMGAVGIVAVCIELSYGGVHYIQNFDGNYIYSGTYGNEADTWRSLVAASGILAGFLITLIPYCSLVRRIKARNVWKQSFLYCVGHRIVSAGRTFYEGRQESERTILMFCVFCGVQIILCCGFGMFGVFLTLVMDAAVLLLLLREASGRKQIEHGLKETKELEEKNLSGEFGSFARFPDLLLMDGGRGQVNIAQQVLDELHLNIPVCGMVKDDNHRTRGLYFHNVELPIDRNSEAFKLITRVQDEAHRFAIEYHRSLRSKDQVKSVLDEIPGVGPARRKALMKSFPSIYEIRDATAEQIAMQADLPMSVAEEIYEFFHNHQEEDCRE